MLYNVASIFFGLLALGVPARVILGVARPGAWSVLASGSCCAAALLCQLLELARRAQLGDFAAIDDTIRAVCLAAAALAAAVLVLNLVALCVGNKRR